jgi:hypothetical protein
MPGRTVPQLLLLCADEVISDGWLRVARRYRVLATVAGQDRQFDNSLGV